MRCTACGHEGARLTGKLKPYTDFECNIYECGSCGARFTPHVEGVHEQLHAASGSTYGGQRHLADEIAAAYRVGDDARIRRMLDEPKYRFVMDEIDKRPELANILEIGCATGYLTAYFLTVGRNALGTDISMTAVQEATSRFGPHFAPVGSPAIEKRAPFDAIFHVGTVGCVPDPVGFTLGLLDKLRPGGWLLFNAPNVDACRLQEGLWGASTPPPDLVTLFRPSFWVDQFSESAAVTVRVTDTEPVRRLQEVLGRRRSAGEVTDLYAAGNSHARSRTHPLIRSLGRGVAKLAAATGLLKTRPDEFGVHIIMRKLSPPAPEPSHETRFAPDV